MGYVSPPSLPSSQPPTRKHSLHYILSPTETELARDAPDVPSVASPTAGLPRPSSSASSSMSYSGSMNSPNKTGAIQRHGNGHVTRRRPRLEDLPRDVLGRIALNVVVDDRGRAGRPSLLLPLLRTSRKLHSKLNFDANPVLYNRLFRATFDLSALIRRTQWMFDTKTDVPGTSNKRELFANPRSWAIEYRDRWALRNYMRACIAHQTVNLPGRSRGNGGRDKEVWALWFLWTENDQKNLQFLTDECLYHKWSMVWYKDVLLTPTLSPGYPNDSAEKSIISWIAVLSGGDMFVEMTPTEVDEKIYMLRPYVFGCHNYEILYAPWTYKYLPLCESGCKRHPTVTGRTVPYKRFGHSHMRAPPPMVSGSYLGFFRLLERQPSRMGVRAGSTYFKGEHPTGTFTVTNILPSFYHDIEWQRNTVCQDLHTSPGLPPLTFLGALQGFWRGNALFFDFEAYRQILGGNMRAVYTNTFVQHAVEAQFRETVIRVRKEDVGGKGNILNAGFADEETEEEQQYIIDGYGHEVLTGDAIYGPEAPGWTKEILLSGVVCSSWGTSRIRGRVRAWDGLVTISIGVSRPYPMGKWVWRGYIHTGGYFIGRWRDTYTPPEQNGYEGPLAFVRAGDIMYPRFFPTSMANGSGVDMVNPDATGVPQGPMPGGTYVVNGRTYRTPHVADSPSAFSTYSNHSNSNHDDPMDGTRGKRKSSLENNDGRPTSRSRLNTAGSSTGSRYDPRDDR